MMEFKIKKQNGETFGRLGKLSINGKGIETPVFWLGKNFSAKPRLQEFDGIDSLILNAYDILKEKSLKTLKEEDKTIHKLLGFKKFIMLDSGGYKFQKKEKMDTTPSEILKVYEFLEPELGVVLDYPFDPSKSEKENYLRWKKTLENTSEMLSADIEVPLMCVVHGYTPEGIAKACKDIKDIFSSNPNFLGIGSLVPLLLHKNSRKVTEINGKDAKYIAIDAIKKVRNEFPDSFLHVFGVGGATTMHTLFAIGVDSIDSIGWRLKAGFGAIQLPGVGDRFVTDQGESKRRRKLDKEEEKLLSKCECPICKDKSLKEQKKLLNNEYSDTFFNRAIHNAHVFKKEEKMFKMHLLKEDEKKFAFDRLYNSPYKKLLKYGVK